VYKSRKGKEGKLPLIVARRFPPRLWPCATEPSRSIPDHDCYRKRNPAPPPYHYFTSCTSVVDLELTTVLGPQTVGLLGRQKLGALCLWCRTLSALSLTTTASAFHTASLRGLLSRGTETAALALAGTMTTLRVLREGRHCGWTAFGLRERGDLVACGAWIEAARPLFALVSERFTSGF
jgi:hypothetical protein